MSALIERRYRSGEQHGSVSRGYTLRLHRRAESNGMD